MNYDCRYDQSFYMALTFLIVITDFPRPVETTETPVETTYATERTMKSTKPPTEVSTEPTDMTDTTKPTKEPVTSPINNNTRPPGLNFDFRYFVFCIILFTMD